MTDYGHDLLFGSFLTPRADRPEQVVALAQLTERLGLDLVTVQDHPYQAKFLDTWTLLSVIAARTARVRVAPNVANLPLRPPAVLARSVATLDLLSGGRVELGLGAGGFPDAVAAMGGPRRSGADAVDALAEAIAVIRAIWAADGPAVRVEGRHHRVVGAHPGPAPAHDVGIWLGAYKPRMLRLTGRLGDGWLPSSPYAPPEKLPAMNRAIDEAATEAGRDPAAVRRLYNITDSFTVEQLADLTLTQGMSGYILLGDDADALRRFAEEVAPAVRELVALGRGSTPAAAEPAAPAAAEPAAASATGAGGHLVEVHDHLRSELDQLRHLVNQVTNGALDAGAARSHINTMTMRQNNWTVGAYCESYCRVVTTHHMLEDRSVFPHLRRADPALAPVLDRLQQEHATIHDVLEGLDRALVAFVAGPDGATALRAALDRLTGTLLPHLSYEESELVEPLSRHGFY